MIKNKTDFDNNLSLEFFFHRNYGRLCLFAKSFLKDATDAEDVVMDVFVRLCEKNDFSLVQKEQFKNYLFMAVRNSCLKVIRREKVTQRYFQLSPFDEIESSTIIKRIIHAEAMGELYEAIEGLPVGCRNIIKRAVFDGKSNQEIADEFGISIHTVKSQKKRGIDLLKLRLNPETNLLWIVILMSLAEPV